MKWKLPNQLTLGRLVLAGAFFVLLALYELPPARRGYLLNVCFAIYLIAAVTDMLDGYLARKWNATSVFGRVTDPFVDKVLVCGAFALLTGSNFSFALRGAGIGEFERSLPVWLTGNMASGVQAWMVVTVVAREFIVSGIRGYSESRGRKFPATIWGKLKMCAQSAAICVVLYQLANLPTARWAIVTKLTLVWLSVAFTAVSALAYVRKAWGLLKSEQ